METEARPLAQPLKGIRVLDFTQALAGPLATYFLAALGAEVIKVENPNGGDIARLNPPFVGKGGPSLKRDDLDAISMSVITRSRGKRSVTLNLKSEKARPVFEQLVRSADVIVENFSAGTADRLGIGYKDARKINPQIIYCAISGFGADDTRNLKAMDSVVQAMSGAALAGGLPGMPPMRAGFPLGDTVAPLFAIIGITSALYRRESSGEGEFVDVSMLGALTALVATEDWAIWKQMNMETRTGSRMPRLAPFGMFKCGNGYLAIAAGTNAFAHSVFRVIGRPELIEDPEFATIQARVKKDVEIAGMIEEWAANLTPEEAASAMAAAGVPCAPVREPIDAVSDPELARRNEVTQVVHPVLGPLAGHYTVGLPIVFGSGVASLGSVAPELGADTDEIYTDLGMSRSEIEELRKSAAI